MRISLLVLSLASSSLLLAACGSAPGLTFATPEEAVQRLTNWAFNMAPMVHISPIISVAIGIAIAYHAVRRRDITLGMIAWLFFIPFIIGGLVLQILLHLWRLVVNR